MKVVKFGGTSLSTAGQLKKACDIILADPARKIVVLSAPGKRYSNDMKVTDLLIMCAEKKLETGEAVNELAAVKSRFAEIAAGLGLDMEINNLIGSDLDARYSSSAADRLRYLDLMKAAGEDNSARLAAYYLKHTGVDATYVNPGDAGLYLNGDYGNAQVLPESYANLSVLRDREGILIFPGFFGYTKAGDVVTFSRGGSDISGSILAAATGAEMYENFTDVDFVFAANPGIVNSPEPIREITYSEMRELSYAGFSVLHEDTLEPVYKAGIPVNIRNTNNPSSPGTLITRSRKMDNGRYVTGVAGASGFCSIFVSKYLMNREIGFGRRLLSILEDEGISYEHMPSGIDNISIIVKERNLPPSIEQKVISRIRNELYVDDVYIERNQSLIIIVGAGMKNIIGLAAKATKALAEAEVNLEMINQGSSEISMMFGVVSENCEKAVRALYNEFFR